MRFSRRARFKRAGALLEAPLVAARRSVRIAIERSGKRVVQGPVDMEARFIDLYERCKPHTLVTLENMYGLFQACRYIEQAGISGDVVICGVWKGGSALLCAQTLLELGSTERAIYLYDTYAGMSEPTEHDVLTSTHERAADIWKLHQKKDHNEWVYAPLEEAKATVSSSGYPTDQLHFVVGKVEETIPGVIPEKIALLHLDTDFYESTLHEMTHLFPRLERGGFIAIDDYGGWAGARQAVDEYLESNRIRLMLHRLDWSGRMGVKLD